MAADASIYSQVRPFAMEDPYAREAKTLQIEGARQQVEEQRRKFTMEDDLSKALSESGGDLTKASTLLASRGRGTAAIQLGDKAAAQKKADVEQKLKLAEAAASDGIAMDAVWRQAVQKAGGNEQAALAAVTPIWNDMRARWAGMGHQLPEGFDPQRNLASAGQAKGVATYLKSLHQTPSDIGKLISERDALPQGDQRRATFDAAIREKTTPSPTELGKLISERDALPAGDPRRAEYDRVLAQYKAGKGDTNVSVNMPGPMMPGKPAQKDIDEGLMNTSRNIMQLDTIANQFKPEYQRFMGKVGFEALKLKDSTAGLTNKERQDLTEFSQYRRNAFSALNDYIKSVTGAAMSEAEAQRILKGLPNPGAGLFDGDSPTEFKAKLDDALKQTKMAAARFAYMKRNGLSLEDGLGKGLTLERMPALMNERGAEIEAELKKGGANPDAKALKSAVRRRLAVEFGLSSD